MTFDIIYAAALLTAGVVSAVTSIVVVGRFRAYTDAIPLTFAATTLAAAVWATAAAFAAVSTTSGEQLRWLQVTWVGVASVTTLWFTFVLSYTGHDDLLNPATLAVLSIEPLTVISLALTPGYHTLVLGAADSSALGPVVAGTSVSPLLFTFHGVYSSTLVGVGLVVLVRQGLRSKRLHRRQVGLVLLASAVPVATLAVGTFGLGLPLAADLTPLSFGLASGIALVGFYRYQLFDVRPIARDVVVGQLQDGVVVVDDTERIVEVNPRARRLFGVDRGALLGEQLTAVPGYGASLRALVDGELDRDEFAIDVDGRERFFEATASVFDGQGAHERGSLVILRDVTERLRTEAEFRALIENSRDLITVVAPDGRCLYCSPSFERVLGRPPDAFVGRDFFEQIHPEDRESVRSVFEQLLAADPGGQDRAEHRIQHVDGSWRRFEAVGVNLTDEPTIRGIVVNARDVTSRRRYEQRLKVLNRVLRHDLRNEVNVIQGHADLLLDRQLTVEAKENARVIRRKADTLAELGEQTRKLDYTLHQTDGVEKPVEITELLRERLDEMQTKFPAAIITSELPDEQWVLADDLVDSALMNVVDNAIVHNDRVAPQIDLSLERVTRDDVDYVEIRVADDGPGIPDAERRVFVEGTETPLSHGSGLGLWLTEWIVTRSNGHLDFAENEPRGTVVTVRLRETAADLAGGAPTPTAPDHSESARRSEPTSTTESTSPSTSTD
jgi:PAS domain S-box-containing protein